MITSEELKTFCDLDKKVREKIISIGPKNQGGHIWFLGRLDVDSDTEGMRVRYDKFFYDDNYGGLKPVDSLVKFISFNVLLEKEES